MYVPLAFIVLISMVKDFFEDFKRHRADAEENNRDVYRYDARHAVFQFEPWKEVRVGDIVRVNNKQRLPCDLILLATSNRKGDCFIETKNLDGETNLKPKYAPASLGRLYQGLPEKEPLNT